MGKRVDSRYKYCPIRCNGANIMLGHLILITIIGSSFGEIFKATCRMKDPELGNCLKESAKGYLTLVSTKGIPEIGLQPIDPFSFPNFAMKMDHKSVKGSLEVWNTTLRGLAGTQFKSVRASLNDPQFSNITVETAHPEIVMEGSYKGKGQVSMFRLDGDGVFKISLGNVRLFATVEAHVYKRDGKDHFKVDRVQVKVGVGQMKIHATNLIKENPKMEKMVLSMANKFWPVFFKVMYPQVQPYIETIIKDAINLVSMLVPIDQLFLA